MSRNRAVTAIAPAAANPATNNIPTIGLPNKVIIRVGMKTLRKRVTIARVIPIGIGRYCLLECDGTEPKLDRLRYSS